MALQLHRSKRLSSSTLALVAAWGVACINQAALAQQVKVATGDPKGTYSRMFRELNEHCGSAIPMVEVSTGGSMANIDALEGNQVNAALVQTDVLVYRSNAEDFSGVKTLVALAPEEVHIIALSKGVSSGGFIGFGEKHRVFNTVSDLNGATVGAAGGSVITAKVISAQAGIPMNVVAYPDNGAALEALRNGQVSAVVAVGGAPLGMVAGLDATFKLLEVPPAMQAKLASVYKLAKVSYPRMNAVGVPTLSIDALFVTRDYKTPVYARGLLQVRQCLYSHLQELAETTGTHPKWQQVSAVNKGKWPFYEPEVK